VPVNADAPAPAPPVPDDPPAPFSELTTRRLGPVRRYFLRHPVAMDVLIVVIFTLNWLLTAVLAAEMSTTDAVVGLVGSLVASAALVWRRRTPLVVTTVLTVLVVVTVALTGTTAAYELGVAFAVYAVAASRPPWAAWSTLVGVVVAIGVAILLWADPVTASVDETGRPIEMDPRPVGVVGFAVMALVALAIGINVRNRRLHIADLVARGNALARDREQQAELARAAERSLIAREMHDVVAHSLSVMIALADGAGVALERSPDKARLALDELSETGRTALADMRRVLGVLAGGGAPLEPQPGHPDLDDLVEGFRAAGLTVRTRGLDAELPGDATVQLAVYRIAQESLTNALRHAPGCVVDLALTATPHVVTVEVISQGGHPVAESPGTGRGIIGMRERAGVYGGTVDAGPWRDGWRVLATLPWGKDAR